MKRIILVLAVLFVAGCATKPQYFHSSISEKDAVDRQMAIDDGYCSMASVGSAPIPQVNYQPDAGTYRTRGTISGYDSSGYNSYNYTATTRQSNSGANSFAQGFANGMNIGNAIAAQQAQEKIYHGCMLAKGWTTDPNAATAAAAAKKKQIIESAEKKWLDAIDEFMKTEASRPNGIDYRNSPADTALLDFHVKALANEDANKDKTMLWFLVEADQLVKTDLLSVKK